MPRIHPCLIRQDQDLLLHRTDQRAHTSCGQIGAPDGRAEQGVSAEQRLLIRNVITASADGVPRRLDHLDLHPCDIQKVAVLHILCAVECIGLPQHSRRGVKLRALQQFLLGSAGIDRRRKFFQEAVQAHDMVKMSVGQEHGLHRQSRILNMAHKFRRAGRHVHKETFFCSLIDHDIAVRPHRTQYKIFNLHVANLLPADIPPAPFFFETDRRVSRSFSRYRSRSRSAGAS